MKHKMVGSYYEDYCAKCEKETVQLVVIPHFTDSDTHECILCDTANYSGLAYEYISELVDSYDEIKVVEWNPEKAITTMSEMLMQNMGDEMLDDEIDFFCHAVRKIYLEDNWGPQEFAELFADQVLIDVSIRLYELKKGVH